jgi:hypothetical protein
MRSVHEQIQYQTLENADEEARREEISTWSSLRCSLLIILHLQRHLPNYVFFYGRAGLTSRANAVFEFKAIICGPIRAAVSESRWTHTSIAGDLDVAIA